MMGASGEPNGYYPMDSSGISVGTQPPVACVCAIFLQSVCAPIVDGGCGGRCEEIPPVLPPSKSTPTPSLPSHPSDEGYRYTMQLGRWHFVGCTPAQERKLRRSLQDLCGVRVGGNTPLRRCLQDMCRDGMVIRCAPAWDPWYSGPWGRNCRAAPPPHNEIVVCPDAFDPQRCGCLGKTLVHEMAHICGEEHPRPYECEWYMYGPGTPPCPN